MGDLLDLAVELGVADAEEYHVVEQQSQCAQKDEKRRDHDELSADLLAAVAGQGNELVDKAGLGRNVILRAEAVGIIVRGVFVDLLGSLCRQRRDHAEILTGQLRFWYARHADTLIDETVAAVVVAEIAQREHLRLFARQGVFLFERFQRFRVGVLLFRPGKRLVAALPVVLGRRFVLGSFSRRDGLYKIFAEGTVVLGAQRVGDDHHVGLFLGRRDVVERLVDQRGVEQRFFDGVQRKAVLRQVLPQFVLAFGQVVLLFLFAYG